MCSGFASAIRFCRFIMTEIPLCGQTDVNLGGSHSVYVSHPLSELSVQQEAISLIHSQFLCDKMG